MKSVQEIKAELASAEKKELEETWKTHILESRTFLNSLIGKTLLRHYSNGGFVMFKVTGVKEQYYADREGWYGQFSPKRWFELETTGYINCRVPMSCGSEFRLGINFNNLKFLKVTGKSKNQVDMSKLELVDLEKEKYTSLPTEVRTFGMSSYSENTPNHLQDIANFKMFTIILDENIYTKAREIAEDNLRKTKEFWEEFKQQIHQSKRV